MHGFKFRKLLCSVLGGQIQCKIFICSQDSVLFEVWGADEPGKWPASGPGRPHYECSLNVWMDRLIWLKRDAGDIALTGSITSLADQILTKKNRIPCLRLGCTGNQKYTPTRERNRSPRMHTGPCKAKMARLKTLRFS